jgi:hypothetical protein
LFNILGILKGHAQKLNNGRMRNWSFGGFTNIGLGGVLARMMIKGI